MKISAIVTFLLFVFSHTKAEFKPGDYCQMNGSSIPGGCTSFENCEKATYNFIFNNIHPTLCGNHKEKLYVCCPGNEPRTTTESTAPVIEEQCQFPPYAVTVSRRTRSKSWNKCIDLADSVFPCVSVGGGVKIRRDTCRYNAVDLILGGTEAMPDEFPHMAALGYDSKLSNEIDWNCGGTLVNEQWVMTAAHCLYNKHTNEPLKYVRLGSEDLNFPTKPEFFFNIIKKVKHPEYSSSCVYNDIALIKLDRAVTYSIKIRPACLHIGVKINDTLAVATGWGHTENGIKSDKLLKVVLEKYSNADCRTKFDTNRKYRNGIIKKKQICFGSHADNKDTCYGDSGGPVQISNDGVHCTYTVIGITSFGKGCGFRNTPAIYTRVSNYIPWIESVVWPN